MRLLLDEMLSPRIAVELRDRGYDVIAVTETRTLRQLPDDDIFLHAQSESRVVDTRNIQDFRPLGHSTIEQGEHHTGLVLIGNRRFPSHDPHATGRLINALQTLLDSTDNLTNAEHWLT